MSLIRTRFAPSPTGFLHIGGVRTALYNWLWARKTNGKFILRIDDTDSDRNVKEALQPILEGFKWLGLTWDEGPEVGGDYGPYYQSQRKFLYDRWLDKLYTTGLAYKDGDAVRFRMNNVLSVSTGYRSDEIVLKDLVRGDVKWDAKLIKDPVIVRSDGKVLYNFATVVDDIDMNITHVYRAVEHLSNTPIQLRLYDALGCKPPEFGHLPFVCAPGSKKKLSKRDSVPVTIEHYIKAGYCPGGIINYLALLGWSLDDHTEIFSRQELIEAFNIFRVHDASASFDPKKFLHINAEQMKRLTHEQKVVYCARHLNTLEIYPDFDILDRVVSACGDRLKTFNDIENYGIFFFRDPVYDEPAFQKRLGDANIVKMLFKFAADIEEAKPFEVSVLESKLHEFCEVHKLKLSDMVHAIRIAITGQPVGPGVFDCMAILGLAETQRRIIKTMKKVNELCNLKLV